MKMLHFTMFLMKVNEYAAFYNVFLNENNENGNRSEQSAGFGASSRWPQIPSARSALGSSGHRPEALNPTLCERASSWLRVSVGYVILGPAARTIF